MSPAPAHVPLSTTAETDAEIRLLLSTDNDGRIPFPEGNNREVAIFLRALSHLDETGHIQHRVRNGCLACYLTDTGMRLKMQAMASRENPGDSRSDVGGWHSGASSMVAMVVFLLILAMPAQARLGESPFRIEARFGRPVQSENGVCARDFRCTYKHNGVVIVVDYLDEKSQRETYANESGAPFTADEIQLLMDANRGGGKWVVKGETTAAKKWTLNGNDAFATENLQKDHSLEMKTSSWQRFIDGHLTAKQGEIERLKDF